MRALIKFKSTLIHPTTSGSGHTNSPLPAHKRQIQAAPKGAAFLEIMIPEPALSICPQRSVGY